MLRLKRTKKGSQEVLTNGRFLKSFIIYSLPSLVPFCMTQTFVAHAQSGQTKKTEAGDKWNLAQQAFARFDYTFALRYATETLAGNPQNSDARRIAAKSAKELRKAGDCLKLMSDAPIANIISDDMNIVGECASLSSFSPWALNFLQKNSASDNNRDSANYWLGWYFYSRGDYPRAEKLLSNIALLPERLEKDRQFKLGRIRDITRAAAPPQAQPSQSTQPLPILPQQLPFKNLDETASSSQKTSRRTPVNKPATQRDHNLISPGWFALTLGGGEIGIAIARGRAINIGPNEQLDYETELNKPGGTFASASPAVKSVVVSVDDLFADVKIAEQVGYLTSASDKGIQTKIALDLGVAATQSKNYSSFYIPLDENPRASESARQASKGWGALSNINLDLALNHNFSLLSKAGYGIYTPALSDAQSVLRLDLGAKLNFDEYEIKGAYRVEKENGKDNLTAGYNAQYSFDLAVSRLSFFSFFAPPGYSLFRYTKSQPVESAAKASSSIILYEMHEGYFWEMNIAPRVNVGESLSFMTWYRYVSGTNRSYVSAKTTTAVRDAAQKTGSYRTFRPSAEFESVSSDLTLEANWNFLKSSFLNSNVFLMDLSTGFVLTRKATRYIESKISSINGLPYSALIDKGAENTTKYYGSLRFHF